MNILNYLIIIWYILNTVYSIKSVYDDIYKKGLDYTILEIIKCSIFIFIIPLGLIVFIMEHKDFIVIKGKKK